MVKFEFSVRQVALVGLLVIVGFVFLFAKGVFSGATAVANPSVIPSGQVQDVILKVSNFGYVTEPAVLQKDVPVRMTVDLSSVQGCARSVTIPEFGVRKLVKQGDNVIVFTPTKSGRFSIACSMNMYKGVLVVA
ncbi:MAG: cupredoxin domain-containing protein [Nanoarchaeota archaeon]|nr:cupredoxin domain-containing protein [Nanoarchaeota archaeon]